jgi:hypothetical protein
MMRNSSLWQYYYYPTLNLFRKYLSISNVSEFREMSFVPQMKSFAVQLERTERNLFDFNLAGIGS